MEFDSPGYLSKRSRPYNPENEKPLLSAEDSARNFEVIERDIAFVLNLVQTRLNESENKNSEEPPAAVPALPPIDPSSGPYALFASKLGTEERILLAMMMAVEYAANELEELVSSLISQKGFSVSDKNFSGYFRRSNSKYIPSLQTIIYLNAGTNRSVWRDIRRQLIGPGSMIARQYVDLVQIDHYDTLTNETELVPVLIDEYFDYLISGREPRADYGSDFPAKLLTTDKAWDQLVVNQSVMQDLSRLTDWLEHGSKVNALGKKYFGSGFTALFYGPPGTGKSMSAALIGKATGRQVFRVDATRIVSKWIGETEKNIMKLFDRMKMYDDAILFFDEADVLFSKRTQIRDAKDKWANLETSVLLPLVEEYPGLIIVATNLEHNLDEAMTRRFQVKIRFAPPRYEERLRLWRIGLPPGFEYLEAEDLTVMLAAYQLTPAEINNVLKACMLHVVKNNRKIIDGPLLLDAIHREKAKSGLTPTEELIPEVRVVKERWRIKGNGAMK